jgi:hypothetical protein
VALVRRLAVPLASALIILCEGNLAQSQTLSEYAVKAAFIVKFASYVEWPDDAGAQRRPFVIAVLGTDPFGRILDDMLTGKDVRGRKILLRRFSTLDQGTLDGADILFVSSSERPDLPRILRTLDKRPILTVGDMDQFAARGGIVGFRLQGNTIRFDINLEQAERAGLKMSSQLLKLARIVRTGEA